jgi:hypothetical protein
MVGARLEYCAKWQQMASAQESNNQMAIGGLRRPTEKIVARQLTDRAGQQKHRSAAIGDHAGLKKNCGAAIEDHAGQLTNRGAAIGFHAGQKKNRGAAIKYRAGR